MKPKQRDFNLVNNDIPHIGTVLSNGFILVGLDTLNFFPIFIWCVWLSQVFFQLLQ